MLTSSAKAKGRRLQQLVRDVFREIGRLHGLEDGDFVSTSMGAPGVDVVLSPAAARVYGTLAVECKNVEKLDVARTFVEHSLKYLDRPPLLIHTKNHYPVMVTTNLATFVALLEKAAALRQAVDFETVRRGE